MTGAACFVSGEAVPGAAVQALFGKEPQLSLEQLDLVCTGALSSAASATKYAVAVAASRHAHSREVLAHVARSLQPGARLYVYESVLVEEQPSASGRADALKKDLVLSGFADIQQLPSPACGGLLVSAHLPLWALGSSAKLSLKRPQPSSVQPEAPPPAPATKAAAWKLAGDDDEDEELVDDEQLLTAEDKAAAAKPDDCEVGSSGRKACKNCTCGRAEAEASDGVKLTAEMLENAPESACGSCYLGDAFRCAGCPYRGMPAFQPGQKITLAANLLTADM